MAVSTDGTEKPSAPLAVEPVSRRGPGGRQPGAGRKPTHGAVIMRRTLRALTTKRLDGRSALAVAVRNWKADVRRDLGGDLTRAQETILESAAQAWVIVSSLDDYIARQPSLVTKKRAVLPVVVQRMQIAEGLARNLARSAPARRLGSARGRGKNRREGQSLACAATDVQAARWCAARALCNVSGKRRREPRGPFPRLRQRV